MKRIRVVMEKKKKDFIYNLKVIRIKRERRIK
jgi:hypothetical protein